jgi:preprotein translocase subunit SecE
MKQESSKTLDRIKWLVSLLFFSLAVWGNSYYSEVAFLYKVLGVSALFILGLIVLSFTNFGSNSLKLMKESRVELRKVVWPSRVETSQTFLIVFGTIIILCLFFWGLESLLSFLTKLVLG